MKATLLNITQTEFDEAILLANIVLDRRNADPDDDFAILARQFLRAVMIVIPKLTEYGHEVGKPGWFQPIQDEKKLKPVIRCNCGQFCGIGLHHVHADGTVTASFFHSKGTNYAIGESPEGCDWQVFLKLADYDGGEFLPRT